MKFTLNPSVRRNLRPDVEVAFEWHDVPSDRAFGQGRSCWAV